MKDNCSKYLGVVTSAGASDEHPMSTRSASDGRRWHSRGMQLICTLVLLFTFAIGNVWADSETVPKTTDNWTGTSCSLTHTECANGSANAKKDGDASDVTYIKFRTNKNGNTMTFEVNEGYKVTGFSIRGYANDNNKAVELTSVTYDSADPIAVGESFPAKSAGTTYTYNNTTNEATSAIVLSFGTNAGTQIMAVITITYEEVSSGPVDPTASFSNGDYTIGGSDLDLSSLFTTNSDGAVTYTITDQGTTDAALRADGKSFYATVAGSAIVKVEQASTSSYNAYDATATITVAACETSISGQPSNASLKVGDANPTLSVTATNVAAYAWKESSDGTSYDGSSTLSTSDSYTPSVNDAVQTKYYYCEVTSSCSGSAVVKSNIVTVEVEAADPPCAELVPATSGDAPAAGDAISLTTATGGSIKALTTNISYTANGLLFGSSSSTKAEVTLNHLMQVGTVITATIYNDNNDKARGLNLLNNSGTSKATWTKTQTGDHVETYTVVASDGLAGSNVFQLQRNNNAYLKSITVSNCGAELHALTSAIDPVTADGKATITLSKSLVAEGATATATYSAIDAAYDFDEWVISGATIDNPKANPVTITMGSTDAIITLKLKTASVKYEVHFDSKGGSAVDDQLVEEGQYASVPTAPTKFKYTFGGWSETDGGSTPANLAEIAINAEKTFYAIWTPKVCPTSGEIYSFVSDGTKAPGSNTYCPASGVQGVVDIATYATVSGGLAQAVHTTTSNNPAQIQTSTSAVKLSHADGYFRALLECPLQEGDTIKFVKTNKVKMAFDSLRTKVVEIASGTGANKDYYIVPAGYAGEDTIMVYYAGSSVNLTSLKVVRPEKLAVTFNMHGHGDAVDAQTIVKGGKVTEPDPTPSAEGYSFDGWYATYVADPESYDDAWDFANDVVSAATELHAKWTAWPTMTLNRGAATSGDDVVTSVEPGSVVTVPACPFSYTDYNFNGWAYSPAVTMVDETHFTMPSENLTLTAQWVDANNVAQIGSTKYATFAEAAAAVADGETIQLLQDCDYDATWTITGMAVTLDLNGKNLTGPASGDAVAITTDGVLTIMDGTATVDPSINGSNEITYAAGKFTGEWLINVYAGGSFVMNSGWLLAGEAAAWVTNSGIVTVNNGVLEALTNAVVMGPGNAGKGGYTMNIHGGILLGHMSADGIANGYSSMAVYHPNTGTLNIDGGTLISENGPGVVVRGGASNITGGTIIAQGNGGGKCGDANAPLIGEVGVAYDFKANYPGVSSVAATISGTANVSGADGAVQAIYAATEPTATEEAAVAISGGTFNTPVAEALCADDYYPATKPSGKYGVTYAAESIDFEAFIDENGTDDAAKTLLASQLAAKHYELSEALNTDHLDAPAGKPQDKGFKVKKTGLEIYFSVEPEKVLEIKTGNISGASIAINGAAAEDLTSTSIATHTYYNDNAQAVVLRMTKADNKYNIFQSINIRNPYQVTLDATTNGGEAVAPMYGKMSVILPSATKGTDHFIGWYDAAENGTLVGLADAEYTPTADVTLYAHFAAQSNDGRLSDLQVDGTTVDGFDMDVHIYNLTVPYGTAVSALPKITLATAYDSYAQGVSIYPTDGPEWRADVDGGCYVQQANVTAEDGSVVYNQVRTKILPKDMACLVWADVPSANTLTYNATKSLMAEDAVTLAINNVSGTDGPAGVKFQKKGYIKIEMNEGTFQAGDVVALDVTGAAGSTMHVFKVQTPSSEADVIGTGEGTTTPVGVNKVAITEDAAALYLARPNDGTYNGWNPHVDYVAVYRPVPNPLVETITFNGAVATVDNDLKTITVEVPATTNLATMPVVASFLSNDPSQTNGAVTGGTWAEGDNEYIVTDKDNDQTVYTVTITKAVPSSDATLSALSYGGTAIALADGVFEYNFELPYGTSDVPALAATAHHAGATIESIDDANAFVNRHATSTVTVKAEDNTTTQLYTVNFTISAWKEIAIWDGSTMSAVATSPDATGLAWATTGFGSIANYNTTCGEKSYTKVLPSGGAATSRYMTITVPKDYVAKFYVVMASHSDGTERGMFIGSNLVKNPDATSILELSNNDRDVAVAGMSEIVGEGTYYINPNASIDFQEIRAYVRKGYARTSMLGNGVYGTVCVPNNVAIEDIQGVTMYELMGRENTYGKLAFDEIVSGELEAGAPYVFQAHGDKMILFYGETSVSEPVDKGNGMYGTFEQIVLTELDDVYYFAQKALWSCEGAVDLTVGANRAYVKLSEIDYLTDPNPAPGRRRVTMTVNGEKVTTDIENINASEKPVKLLINGQIFIFRGEKLFDTTGKLVK